MFWHICSPTTPQTFPPWLRFAMVLGPRIRIGSVRGSKIMFLGAIKQMGHSTFGEVEGRWTKSNMLHYWRKYLHHGWLKMQPGQPIIVCKTIPQSTKLNLYCNILCFGWQLAVHRAQSPDLNPIETVHGTYGHTLPRVCTPLKSRVEESSPWVLEDCREGLQPCLKNN